MEIEIWQAWTLLSCFAFLGMRAAISKSSCIKLEGFGKYEWVAMIVSTFVPIIGIGSYFFVVVVPFLIKERDLYSHLKDKE